MATIVRRSWAKALWLMWPAWVWFAVIATGNHFWLDVVAGVALAIAAGAFVYRRQLRAALATH
jgi:membrane-associated phospholipid phosphatase